MKKLLSVLFAAALVLSLFPGVVTAAEAVAEPNWYSVNVGGGTVRFVRNGNVAAYEAEQPVRLTLRANKNGDMLVQFYQPDSRKRNIRLNGQKKLAVDGEIDSIVMEKSLRKEMSVSVSSSASVNQLTVKSDSEVSVKGSVKTVVVSGPAKVSVADGAAVSTLRVTSSSAKVRVESNAEVDKVLSVEKSAVSGDVMVTQISGSSSGGSSGKNQPPDSSSSSDGSRPSIPSRPDPPTVPDPPPVPDVPTDPDVPTVPDVPTDPDYSGVSISNVYPTTSGGVRVELNRPVPLDASAFYISCPSGKDMTILKVETVTGADANRVYNLTTAYYTGNAYVLEVTLPDGRKLTRALQAETASKVPEAGNLQAERVNANTARFSFDSNLAGTIYYIVSDGSPIPQSAEEIKRTGTEKTVAVGQNQFQITGLAPGVDYSLYLVLADTEGNSLSGILPELKVPAEPPLNPNEAEITILSIEQIKNYGFRVVLSRPTAQKLGIDAFFAKCPAQAELSLGRAETADNQTYEVYMKDGWYFLSRNTYDVRVTFPDGTIASGSFYAETYPSIGSITGMRYTDGSVTITFASDKPGKIYYGTVPNKKNRPDSVDEVLASGTQADLFAGGNKLNLNNVPADHYYFYMVAVDQKGNMAAFVNGGDIKDTGTTPGGDTGSNAIADVAASTQTSEAGPCTVLDVTLKEAVNVTSMENSMFAFTTLEGGSPRPPQVVSVSYGPNTVTSDHLLLTLNEEIPAGSRYKITITLPDGNLISKEFSVGQSQALTIGFSN